MEKNHYFGRLNKFEYILKNIQTLIKNHPNILKDFANNSAETSLKAEKCPLRPAVA